jgi:hypothetical protein
MLEGLKAHLTECETESRGEHQWNGGKKFWIGS